MNVKKTFSIAAVVASLALGAPAVESPVLDGRATAPERITAANAAVAGETRVWRGRAWRNERVHATFVVRGAPGTELHLGASALKSADGGTIVPIATRQVLESLADDWLMGQKKDFAALKSHPVGEALDDALPVTLNDRGFRAVWVTIKVPAETRPGLYRGEFKVAVKTKDGGAIAGNALTFPIELEVLPATLPAKKKMYLDIWQTPWAVARYYGVEPFSEAHFKYLEPIYRELADAGQRTITLTMTDYAWNIRKHIDTARSMIEYVKGSDGQFRADFTLLDRYVEFCERCGLGPDLHFYALARFENQTSYWYWNERNWTYNHIDCKAGSPEFESYWTPLLKQLEAHAKAKGWEGRVYVALDELKRDDVKACSELLAKCAPSFKFQMSGNRNPSMFEGIRIDNYSQELRNPSYVDERFRATLAERKAKGIITTAYVCCNPPRPNCLVRSPLHEQRWLGLYLYALGVDGFLKSTSHRWMNHVDPLVDTNCRPHFPCGDSFLLYPGARSSVRWESLRDGWEDYEKLACLEARGAFTPELKAALSNIDFERFLSGDDAQAQRDVEAVERAIDGCLKNCHHGK